MPAIHLIKKTDAGLPAIVPVAGEPNAYTCGFWTLGEEKARSLIGGQIYFHERQRDPSFYGGQIVDARRTVGGEYAGKVVFKFIFSEDCRGVTTGRDGWSQEMKLEP
jgi:hypothetical protein